MAEGLFTLDQDGTITAWNRAMEKISGYTAEQAMGQTCGLIKCSRCYDQSHPMDISQCKVLTRGQAEAKECFIRHKDGYDVPVIKNARLVRDEKDNVLGIVETLTDLTEIKAIKAREASAKQELKKALRPWQYHWKISSHGKGVPCPSGRQQTAGPPSDPG